MLLNPEHLHQKILPKSSLIENVKIASSERSVG